MPARSRTTRLPKLDSKSTSTLTAGQSYILNEDDRTVSRTDSPSLRVSAATRLSQLMREGPQVELKLSKMNFGPSHTDDVIDLIAKSTSALKILNLSGNPQIEADLPQVLTPLQTQNVLVNLQLNNAGLTDRVLEQVCAGLGSCRHLEILSLTGNSFSSSGCTPLAGLLTGLPSLTTLILSNNKIRDAGMEILAQAMDWNTTLEVLDVSSCWMTDAGMVSLGVALARHRTLRELNLSKNTLSPEAVDGLAALLQKNTSLTKVHVTGIDTVNSEQLRRLTRRNDEMQHDHLPRALQDELSRLYVQKYKLQMAATSLKEHQQQTLQFHDQANRVENEFATEKDDIQRKAKRSTELCIYEQASIRELKQRQEETKDNQARDKDMAEQEWQKLQESLVDKTKEREIREADANVEGEKLAKMREELEGRKATLQAQIEAVKEEKAAEVAKFRACQERIMQIKQQVADMEMRLEPAAAARPPVDLGQAMSSANAAATGKAAGKEGGKEKKKKKGKKAAGAAEAPAA